MAAELKQIESKGAELEFASPDELEKLKLLADNSKRLKVLRGTSEDILEQKNKHLSINGLILWKIKTDYPVRLWAAKKELNQLDKPLQT